MKTTRQTENDSKTIPMPHINRIMSTETAKNHLSNPIFLCVLSNTDTCRIPGISAAGATTELNDYTPAADAEIEA